MSNAIANPYQGQDEPGTPNLDDFSHEPAEVEAVAEAFLLLGSYLERRARMIRARKAGTLRLARELEKTNEAIYKALPEWAKW